MEEEEMHQMQIWQYLLQIYLFKENLDHQLGFCNLYYDLIKNFAVYISQHSNCRFTFISWTSLLSEASRLF